MKPSSTSNAPAGADPAGGQIINLNAYGGTVRLDDGRLAGIALEDLERNRAAYERAYHSRKVVRFSVVERGRHAVALLVPALEDDQLEEQIAAYLKATQEWEKPDVPPAHERHFLKKKRRAALFESRHSTER